MLARRNLQPTQAKRWMTVRGHREPQALPLAPIPATIREDCLALLRMLDAQIRRLDLDLRPRLGTTPGPAAADHPWHRALHRHRACPRTRRRSAVSHRQHLASYVGLTPRVRASADRVRSGHISKEGNRLLRWVLVTAATQAVRRPGPLRAWFRAVQHRKGKKIARVALVSGQI